MSHERQAIVNTGWNEGEPCWKLVCVCGWECWEQATRDDAIELHRVHVAARAAVDEAVDELRGLYP